MSTAWILLIVAGLGCLWNGVDSVRSELHEKAPTQINVADLPGTYKGQRWLSITGQLDP